MYSIYAVNTSEALLKAEEIEYIGIHAEFITKSIEIIYLFARIALSFKF